MSDTFLDGTGTITNYLLSDPDDAWYETQSTDEVILFLDRDGIQRSVNDWQIFANSTNLLIQLMILDKDGNPVERSDVITIFAGDSWGNGKIRTQGIKVIGASGQKIRYVANYY